jgi:ACS family tartrate transporter-like MFS transporter
MLPKEALTFPFSALEASVSCANVLSAPLAAFLLILEGKMGMAGWQWLFLLEGIATMVIGSCAGMLLPASIHQATFLRGCDRRVIQEQQGRTWLPSIGGFSEPGQLTDASLLREAVTNWKVWYVSVMSILKNVAANALLFWLPIIVASLLEHDGGGHGGPPSALVAAANVTATAAAGAPVAASGRHLLAGGGISFGSGKPNALSLPVLLSSIPFACVAVFALLLGRSSQATGDRAMHLFVPYLTAGLIFCALSHIRAMSVVAAFVALCAALACTVGPNCISNAYIPAIASSSSVSVAMALYNSVGNLGGMLGPWIIGVVVESTGSYDQAIQLLGVFMLVAAAMAWYTRRWENHVPAKCSVDVGALMNNRSVGSEMSSLMK